jgi:hypothetical protein
MVGKTPNESSGPCLMGCLMKSATATHILPDEHFVLQIDGQIKSQHRRFVDALIAGLLLRNQFPQHDIKVRQTQTSVHVSEVVQGTIVH